MPVHGEVPYGLSWDELEPDPGAVAHATPWSAVSGLQLLRKTKSVEDLERVLDAALALACRMLTRPEHLAWSRGRILAVALETAALWERG